MAKKNLFGSPKKLLSAMKGMTMPTEQKMPMEARVRKADNDGYIVTLSGGDNSYPGKEKVYDSMEGVMECMNEAFGKKKGHKG